MRLLRRNTSFGAVRSMTDYFKSAFERANQSPRSIAPDGLINALGETEDPMAYIQGGWADFPEIDGASQKELGHIDTCRVHLVQGSDLPPELDGQLVATISWLLKQIEIFESHQASSRVTLAAILEVCARLSQVSAFWAYVPRDKISPNFRQVMHDVLARIVHSSSDAGAPVWERELMQSINEADTNERWSVLSKHWQAFEHVVRPHYLFSEASRFLYAQDLVGLIQIVDGMTTMWDILHAVQRLTAIEKIHLASLSQNSRARFVLVQDALFHFPKNEALSEQQSEYLENILIKVIASNQEWDEWMSAFNEYPVRVPQLQEALGRALSNGDYAQLCSYINAISLYPHDNDCRLHVTECLRAFRDNAPLEKRQELWRIAYGRWERWDFGISVGDVNLTQVAWSQIDFAVIGYFLEVLEQSELEKLRSEFSKVFYYMQFEWYAKDVEFTHVYHREISRSALIPDPSASVHEWSLPTSYRVPFGPKLDRYFGLTFSLSCPPKFGH